MENLFLQNTFSIDPVAIIIAVSSISVSIGTLIYARSRSKNQDRQLTNIEDKQYVELFTKTMSDLHDVYKTEKDVKTKDQCELFATRLLDILAVLTHLNNTGKISNEILDFIKFDLTIGKGVMEWFDTHNMNQKYNTPTQEIWSNLNTYFEKHDVESCMPQLLPLVMRNYADLPESIENCE